MPKHLLLLLALAFAPFTSARSFEAAPENELSFSSTAAARLAEGSRRFADLDGTHLRVAHGTTLTYPGGAALLAGIAFEQYGFDAPASTPVPAHLRSASLTLGWRQPIDEHWSWQVEAHPGLYGESLGAGSDGFDVPVSLRLVRASSATLQWAVGLDYDPRSGHPLVGGLGVRWQFAPHWTLLALPPAPQVEYEFSPQLTGFAGLALQRGSYRVAADFGRTHGRPALDHAIVDYREIVVQAGARWRPAPQFELAASAGWLTDRRFAFAEQNLLVHGSGAPYLRAAITHRY
jgi:hypothetical protein